MSDSLTITLIYGSYRSDRNGIRAVRYLQSKLEARGHHVQVVDAQEQDLPILDKMYKEYDKGSAPEALQTLADMYSKTDAFVVVAGEYNHSIQPGLSNILDYFLEEYSWRPSAIVSYSVGGFGGVRAAMQLRAMLGELGMPSIPSIFAISQIHKTLKEDGTDSKSTLTKFAERYMNELEWYANALKAQRDKGVPY